MQPPKRKIFDVVGEAATNADGRKRQDILCEVEPGERVDLTREPQNPYDSNAIAVTIHGETVGYIAREDAAVLTPLLDAGQSHAAIVHCIRGGVPGATHYGCQVSIAWEGAKPHPFRALDEVQRKSRAGKVSVLGRGRDDRGQSVPSRSGCSVLVAMIAGIGLLGTSLFGLR
jgi:hypothetical protein